MTYTRIISVAALALCLSAPAIAQRGGADPETGTKIQQKWDKYKSVPALGGFQDLEEIAASRALPATKENAKDMLKLLRSGVPKGDKVMLLRMAGAQVIDLDEAEPTREELRRYLAEVAKTETDPELGKAATLTYSRIGYYPDSIEVLRQARVKNHISNDEFFGDLAHLLPAASTEADQVEILRNLTNGRNDLSIVILSSLLSNPEYIKLLKPGAAVKARTLLGERAPEFSKSTNTISTVDAIRYGDWFSAYVRLTAQITGDPERLVLARLLKVDDNPKRLMGVLLNDYNVNLIRDGLDRQSIAKIDSNIAAFAASAQNAWVTELSAGVRKRLADGPPK